MKLPPNGSKGSPPMTTPNTNPPGIQRFESDSSLAHAMWRLVAATTITPLFPSKPSISVKILGMFFSTWKFDQLTAFSHMAIWIVFRKFLHGDPSANLLYTGLENGLTILGTDVQFDKLRERKEQAVWPRDSSWWFQPIWKIWVEMDHFPRWGSK